MSTARVWGSTLCSNHYYWDRNKKAWVWPPTCVYEVDGKDEQAAQIVIPYKEKEIQEVKIVKG